MEVKNPDKMKIIKIKILNQRCKYKCKLNKNIEKKHKEKKEKNNNDFISTNNLNLRQ